MLFVTFGLVNTAFNIFTDVFFATIPIPIIWTLQMRRKVRIYLIGILSLGYLAVVFGVLNAIYQIAFTTITDRYLNDWILFWATLQFTTGIIAACIPSLKPLVSSVLKLSEYSNSRSQGLHGSHYRSQRAATGTRGSSHTMGGGGGNHMWSIHRGDQYALQELGSRGSGDASNSDEVRLTQNGDYNVTAAYTQNFSASDETPPGHPSLDLGNLNSIFDQYYWYYE
ncbi:hypothetical protein N7481_013328 [Penicillium waksmanii]|uniref:uncharacterized protein n=1 Tax=Penicillium waksmanii TaxID=69791 RepID=UPI002548A0C7|nr:uncharacterized protein N7481_013328 [Penicillium waksmanii]KAJ5966614.1 hypothetical protein N7481_013328 [Penicillium waksmanii]